MRNHFLYKIGFIALLIVLLMIPQMMLESLISERDGWRSRAYSSIERSWPGAQTLGGPILAVPYQMIWMVSEVINDGSKRVVTRQQISHSTAYLLPKTLEAASELETTIRYRGIYEVPVYSGAARFKGEFDTQPLLDIVSENPEKRIEWGTPQVSVLVSDQRGIVRSGPLQWMGQELEFKPGSGTPKYTNGMHVKVPRLDTQRGETIPFAFDMDLQGMKSMQFALLAETMDIRLSADWAHPGFFGDMLPETRDIDDKGFSSRWRSSAFSGNTAEALAGLHNGDGRNLMQRTVGVNFVQPVDVYQQSERSIKYALLFLLLTFSCMTLFELLKKLPLHPVQYTFVGVALLIFYLLLIALSEHISFLWAYVCASLACTGLLTAYFGAILRSRRHGLVLGSGLSALYALLYIILQAEDHALVMGSLLLFAVLSAIMLGTRRFDWYALTAKAEPPKTFSFEEAKE